MSVLQTVAGRLCVFLEIINNKNNKKEKKGGLVEIDLSLPKLQF